MTEQAHISAIPLKLRITEKIGGMTVLIAEPEKALVDYLYFVSLKKRLSMNALISAN